ncbi:MAG: hypothetical protein COA90_04905 [Gammaproteobacteria bacterium]|nr:MAG: hypothetical protein COA90_04905 [Gammaproteobacteria bacterium]
MLNSMNERLSREINFMIKNLDHIIENTMDRDKLKTVFAQQASGYEKQQEKLAPIRNGLHFLLESVFSEPPAAARILCVGLELKGSLTSL